MAIFDGRPVAVEMLNEGRGKGCKLNSWLACLFTVVTGATYELPKAIAARPIQMGTGPGNPQAMDGGRFLAKVLVIPSDNYRSRGKRLKKLIEEFMSTIPRVTPATNLNRTTSEA